MLPGINSREKSGPSKTPGSTPGSKADSDQANARAHYTSVTEFGNFIQRDEHRRENHQAVKALDVEDDLILLDSEIPKPHKNSQL